MPGTTFARDASMATTQHIRSTYYAHPDVRARIAEFLGGPALECASCVYILSGRGHHFVWPIPRQSDAFAQLVDLGHVPQSLGRRYAQPHPPTNSQVEPVVGRACAGLGLVFEYLTHGIKAIAAPLCDVPVELTAVAVGPGARGRELVSLDISEYGDPLHTRMLRIPFSAYLKPLQQRRWLGEAIVETLPPLFLVPLHAMDVSTGLAVMRDPAQVVALARRASVQIPDQSQPMAGLVTAYLETPRTMGLSQRAGGASGIDVAALRASRYAFSYRGLA